MKRIAILGNSGSGKSTLAKALAAKHFIPVLDLDSIAWEPKKIAVPRAPEAVLADLNAFCKGSAGWIVEGCYGDLIEAALRWDPQLVFVNPGEEVCLRHCRARPWEPNKYASKEAQDAKLDFLLKWVSEYYTREGTMSLKGHRAVFDAYAGAKRETR